MRRRGKGKAVYINEESYNGEWKNMKDMGMAL